MKRTILLFTIVVLFVLVGCDSETKTETSKTTSCKENCRNSTSLKELSPMVNFDPIGICERECVRTQGNCPASDGSGGLFTGCEYYGASGGKLSY